jgi:hypothetical protein
VDPITSDRPRPVQAERLSLSITTVVAIVIGLISLLTTATVTVGVTLNRLSNAEGRLSAVEQKDGETTQARLDLRDLQNQQAALKDGLENLRRDHDAVKRTLGEATNLLLTLCLNEERQRRYGMTCRVVQP